jgi:DNA-binding transcriptional MerR regulator
MSQADLMSINIVAAKLGLSVHQLRRWELMFGLEIKRGRGQQRQYRPEDLTVIERIKELVDQGWPTSQIRPQLEAEGLITPKLIGLPPPPGSQEVVMETLIGLRNFTERRFIELSKQIDELRQLLITLSLKQELKGETAYPWQPVEEETITTFYTPPPPREVEEITIGPAVTSATAQDTPADALSSHEVTDQNYLTMLGRYLDMVSWSDDEADNYCNRTFGIPHWDNLGRSQAEAMIDFLKTQLPEEVVQESV